MVKGALGLRRTRLRSISATEKVPASTAALAASAAAALGRSNWSSLRPLRRGQPGGEGGAGGRRHLRFDRPVFAGPEGLDLGFALADQAEGDGLHPASAAAARQLAPEHRGEGEAHEVIEGAAGEIGLYEWLIQLARLAHSRCHGVAGDLVEGHAMDDLAPQRVLVLQHGADVPGDRLALTIRIGCKV